MEKYKDPAFLFYPESFLVGTLYMTDEEVGQYIKLLCAQHQKGHIPKYVMDKQAAAVREKFIKDSDGNYYNERLEYEIERRKTYTDSRRKNGAKGGRPKKADEKPAAKKRTSVKEWVEDTVPAELQDAFLEWCSMRKSIGKPITTKATITRNYNKLCELSKRTDKQIRIIEQSVDKCWQSFYELPASEQKRPQYKELPTRENSNSETVEMPEEIRKAVAKIGKKI